MDYMNKKDWFYSSGSVFGILSCVLKFIEMLGKDGLATYAIVAIFVLLTTFLIVVLGYFFMYINKEAMNSLKDTNKTIQEQLSQLIQSQSKHIEKQEERFQKPEIQSSANNS